MNEQTATKKMSFFTKFAYSMGGFGGNTALLLITSFFVYFCTDSIGLSAGIVGTLLMIAKLLDGISDIIMGFIINKTHSKLGKARFWIILCAAPFGLTTFLLFFIPSFFSDTASYVYIFIMYVLQNAVFYTMYTVATQALMSYATKDPNERYSMQSMFSLVGVLPAILLSFLGQSMAAAIGWTMTALICGAISFLTVLFAGVVVKELPEEQLEDTAVAKSDSIGFITSVKVLLMNKYFWILLGIYFAIYILTGVQGTSAVYYCTYIFQSETAFGFLYLAMYAPLIIFVGFVPKLVEKFGARKINILGSIFSIITACIAFINPYSVIVVSITLFLITLGGLPSYVTLTPLVSEIAENIKMKTNKDITAMCYACSSVGVKLGTGLGTAIAGILLTATGYDGMASVQTDVALNGIRLMFIVSPIIAYVAMAVLFQLLDVAEVNQKLRNRK